MKKKRRTVMSRYWKKDWGKPHSGKPMDSLAKLKTDHVWDAHVHMMIEHLCLFVPDIVWLDHGFCQHWNAGVKLLTSTIQRRLKAVGLRSRLPIRRPFLTPRHVQEQLPWNRRRVRWNLQSSANRRRKMG